VDAVCSPGEIVLSQPAYIRQMTASFGIDDGIETTPMEANLAVERSEIKCEDRKYRAMIGALLYVARFSRPDIMVATNLLARH